MADWIEQRRASAAAARKKGRLELLAKRARESTLERAMARRWRHRK